MKYDINYRGNLKPLIGSNISMDCDDFMLTKRNSNGRQFILLNSPKITKARGSGKLNRRIGHLWCEVDGTTVKYLRLANTIRITGRVYEYQKECGVMQVGIKVHKIDILKYDKDIATRYNLSGRERLPEHKMDKVLGETQL